VLEEYLETFPGAVIVVSHDRAFLDNTVDHLLVFDGEGHISHFPGGYTPYRQARAAAEAQAEQAARQVQAQASVKEREKERSDKPRKLSFKEQRELSQLETRIPELEAEVARLTDAINGAGADYTAFGRLNEQLLAAQAQLEQAFERWTVLAEIAEQG
jgi:ABC transport system ATP-binding/permease protein